MAEKDRLIKSGQLTLPRLIFLALVGAVIVATVYLGGVWLTIGYWLLTIAICVLLFLIAIDYGVKMDKVDLASPQAPLSVTPAEPVASSPSIKTAPEARPKRRTARPAKRRR